jgi:hypothetical protein
LVVEGGGWVGRGFLEEGQVLRKVANQRQAISQPVLIKVIRCENPVLTSRIGLNCIGRTRQHKISLGVQATVISALEKLTDLALAILHHQREIIARIIASPSFDV